MDKIIVNKKQLDQGKWFLAGSGALSILVGGWLALVNPQLTSIERDNAIYNGGIFRKSVVYKPDKRARNAGIVAMLLGLGMTAGALSLNQDDDLSSAEKVENRLKDSDPISAKKDEDIKLDPKQKEGLRDRLLMQMSQVPWLLQLLNSPAIVIVGDSGTGKSRLAMVIALLKIFCTNATLRIADPDGYQNIERGAWIAGDIYGANPDIHKSQQEIEVLLKSLLNESGERTLSYNPEITIIDEFSKWATEFPLLKQYGERIVLYGAQAVRKRRQCNIYLLHSLKKGMSGGEDMTSGALDSLLSYASVLYLPGEESDILGNQPKASTVWYKRSGIPFKSSNDQPTIKSAMGGEWFSLPKGLDPEPFAKQYGKYLESYGVKLRTFADIQAAKEQQNFEDFKRKVTPHLPGLTKLDQLERQEKLEAMFDLDLNNSNLSHTLTDKQKKFIDYLKRSKKFSVNQPILINSIFDSWKKSGGFTGKGAKQDFVTFLKTLPNATITDIHFTYSETGE